MLKKLKPVTKIMLLAIAAVIVVMVILISFSGNQVSSTQPHYAQDNATADNKVEALKTMTADLMAVQAKNKNLASELAQLNMQRQAESQQLQQNLQHQLAQAIQTLQAKNKVIEQQFSPPAEEVDDDHHPIFIHGEQAASLSNLQWIGDLSPEYHMNQHAAQSSQATNAFDNLLHPEDHSSHKTKTSTPYYTIPKNATLTGATLLTPLVGRVPIDGKLTSPYRFKAVLSADNLTANGYPLPGIQGAVVSGVASGDMLARCARGSFHSNAAIFLGAQMALAGAEGYGNALSQAQLSNDVSPEGASIRTLIGSANQYATGQAATSASIAAQNWWNERIKNSFDYIYVPNIDAATKQPLHVVINITQQINIDHNVKARKVAYEISAPHDFNQLD